MKVQVVHPHGYCQGVFRALKVAWEAKTKYPDQNVYLLGMIVHNEFAVAALKEKGFFLLDERKAPLEEQLEQREKGDVIVYSAHGHPRRFHEISLERGLIEIDATCPFVLENEKLALNAVRPLYYLGIKGHLESEGFLANCPDAIFLDAEDPICKENGDKASLLAQTTLSEEEWEKGLEELQNHYSIVHALPSRCDATKIRQQAIKNLPLDTEMLIVLGSAHSNNSRKLVEIGKERGIPSYLILDENELSRLPLEGKKSVALASGASTPSEVYERVKKALETI